MTKNIFAILCLVAVGSLFSCDQESVPEVTPQLSISDRSGDENANPTLTYTVSMDVPSKKEVTVLYYTIDGSAQGGPDFSKLAGTLTFAPGETSKELVVTLVNDEFKEAIETFEVGIYSATNAEIAKPRAKVTVTDSDEGRREDEEGFTSPATYAGFDLVWNDEFAGPTMDPLIYNFEKGASGWGNNELQDYTENNEIFEEGNLVIEARKEGTPEVPKYTSARITTQNKKLFKYGRIDIRAKLPNTKGIWPALWMLGNNISSVGWPACGEIDIMEMVGQEPHVMKGTAHWGSNTANHIYKGQGVNILPETFDQKFHVFSIYWKENYLYFYLDDQLYYTLDYTMTEGQPWPFNKEFFFIFNVAVGGNWPGPPDETSVFPQRMTIDYVRVFQSSAD